MDTIKATLRNSEGSFETNLELIGYEKAPATIDLNVEGLGDRYSLEAVDKPHTRAHYQSVAH